MSGGCGSCDLERFQERGESLSSLCFQCQRFLNDNSDGPCKMNPTIFYFGEVLTPEGVVLLGSGSQATEDDALECVESQMESLKYIHEFTGPAWYQVVGCPFGGGKKFVVIQDSINWEVV